MLTHYINSSPPNCQDDSCVSANSWYWLGKGGAKIALTADHLAFMGQMDANDRSNCLRIVGTNYYDIGCSQQKQSVCEVEGM